MNNLNKLKIELRLEILKYNKEQREEQTNKHWEELMNPKLDWEQELRDMITTWHDSRRILESK